MNINYDYAKPINLIEYLIRIGCERNDIVVDFFAGSGTTAEAVVSLNTKEGANRKFMCVQLPERPKGNKNNDFSTLAEIAKKRIKIFLKRTRELNPLLTGDLGFRVFKLDSTNIREWDPNPDSLAESLEAAIEHLKSDRSEQDILFELLLKLGLDLCVPIEQRSLPGSAGQAHTLHSIGAGTLMVCLSTSIPLADVEPLALALVAWHEELQPAGDTTVVFRDSAFPDDVAKTNLTAILQQHGLESVRSL